MLAHPICLCLAMIVYAVHVSIWYCRWFWWGIGLERGLVWEKNYQSFDDFTVFW